MDKHASSGSPSPPSPPDLFLSKPWGMLLLFATVLCMGFFLQRFDRDVRRDVVEVDLGGVRSQCRFSKSGTDSRRASGMKWMSGSTQRQCDRAQAQTSAPKCAGIRSTWPDGSLFRSAAATLWFGRLRNKSTEYVSKSGIKIVNK